VLSEKESGYFVIVTIDIRWHLKDAFCHPNPFERCSFCAGFHWHKLGGWPSVSCYDDFVFFSLLERFNQAGKTRFCFQHIHRTH
jgi:hypothetical protein